MPDNENEKLYKGAAMDVPAEVATCDHGYAELDVASNFSFLRGASHPDELVYTAALLGCRAMAVTDINSFAGVVRAFEAAKKVKGFQLIIGARLAFADGTPDLLAWPTDRAAYGRLCRLLTRGRRGQLNTVSDDRVASGGCRITLADFIEHSDGVLCALDAKSFLDASPLCDENVIHTLRDALGDRLSLAASVMLDGDDRSRLDALAALGRRVGVPLVATNHVHYHDPGRRRLQDVLTCVRHGCRIQDAGFKLFSNAERYLKSPEHMHRLFADHPAAIERGLAIARQCNFKLSELKYEYPTEAVPPGMTPSRYLRRLTHAKARWRYPNGVPKPVRELLWKELTFICGSKYESYFLTVYDLVREARSRGILCQGRGSAANSAVCYCLGVTAVDPAKFQLVFERFASTARAEPPDIDIDFEHERREEVIQYVYDKYGRDKAAMTGSLITYRGRSAIRDVGKALGMSVDLLDALAGKLDWWHKGMPSDAQISEAGVDPRDPTIRQLFELCAALAGFPRHLGQHVGGMIISRDPLCELVPIADASMEDRTVIEWDKDDLDTVDLFKIDILALGMLTCISKSMAMVDAYTSGPPLELATLPHECPRTYEMISDADTVGVFQIESRAQMSMLPRMRPDRFYDLVIEVAIVRPGPIQGDMVHPYLQRRERRRADPTYRVHYPHPELEDVLQKTLGVPLFQEQAMRLAIVAAKFTGAEADALRRSMAAWRKTEGVHKFHDRFVTGMTSRGYEPDFAENCFKQICGFGEYGFPESHAASFAILVYASCWLKRHHPAAFTAGLLNSQPMGFYAPAQLVRDAREHGVTVRPIDVNASDWDCTLEDATPPPNAASPDKRIWGVGGPALRLGFRQIKGMRRDEATRIVVARRRHGPFTSVEQFHRVAGVPQSAVQRLAEADAFSSIRESRRSVTWRAMALSREPMPLFDGLDAVEPAPALPTMPPLQEVLTDYNKVGLSLKRHPVAFARAALSKWRVQPAVALNDATTHRHAKWVSVAGLVLVRQRPGTASGVVFITLEDETGVVNLILWSHVYERYRRAARYATLLQADGYVQREGQVTHVLGKRLFDRSELLGDVSQRSRDFH